MTVENQGKPEPTKWQNYNHALVRYIHNSLTVASCHDSINSSNNQSDKYFIELFYICRQLALKLELIKPKKSVDSDKVGIDKTGKEKVKDRYEMAPSRVLISFLKCFPREVLASRIEDIDHQVSVSIIDLHCRTILYIKSLQDYLEDQLTSAGKEPENTDTSMLSSLMNIETFLDNEFMYFLASIYKECSETCDCQNQITQVNTKFIELSNVIGFKTCKIKLENIHYWKPIKASLSPQAGATIDNQVNVSFYLDKDDLLRKRADNQRVIRYKYFTSDKAKESPSLASADTAIKSTKSATAIIKGVNKNEDQSIKASTIINADILSAWPNLQVIPPQEWDLSLIPLSTLSELLDKCRLFNGGYFIKNVENRVIDKWRKEDWWIENSYDALFTTTTASQNEQDESDDQETNFDPDSDDSENELPMLPLLKSSEEDNEEDPEEPVCPEQLFGNPQDIDLLDDFDSDELKIKLFLKGISGIQKETANFVLSVIAQEFRNYVGQKNQLKYALVLCEKLKGRTADEITKKFPKDQYPFMSGDMKDNIDKCSHGLVYALCNFPVDLDIESTKNPTINQSLIDLIVLNPYTIVYFTENAKSQKHLESIVSYFITLPRSLFGVWACLTETNRSAITKHLSDTTNASLHKALLIGEPLHWEKLVNNIYRNLDSLTLVAEKLAARNQLITKDDYSAIQRELIMSIKRFELHGGNLTDLIINKVNTTDSSTGLRLRWFIQENQHTFKFSFGAIANDPLLSSTMTTAMLTIAESIAYRPSNIQSYEFSDFAINSIIGTLITQPVLLTSFWGKLDDTFKKYLSKHLEPETFNTLWRCVGYSKPPELYAKLNSKSTENATLGKIKQQSKEEISEHINKAGKSGINVGEYLFEQVGSLAKIAAKYLEPSDWLSEN